MKQTSRSSRQCGQTRALRAVLDAASGLISGVGSAFAPKRALEIPCRIR